MDWHVYKLLIPVTPLGLLFYLLVVILFIMGSHTYTQSTRDGKAGVYEVKDSLAYLSRPSQINRRNEKSNNDMCRG